MPVNCDKGDTKEDNTLKKAHEKTGEVESEIRNPVLTHEAREAELISLAMDQAEKQLREGTASSQIVTHYLKLGAEKEKLEAELLKKQMKLIDAKIKAYESAEDMKSLYERALNAMKLYSGDKDGEDAYLFGADGNSGL